MCLGLMAWGMKVGESIASPCQQWLADGHKTIPGSCRQGALLCDIRHTRTWHGRA